LKSGLDEIIEALPSRSLSADEADFEGFHDDYGRPMEGITMGPRVEFDTAYRNILEAKSEEKTNEEAA